MGKLLRLRETYATMQRAKEQPPAAAAPPGMHGYHPEMGEAKPTCQMEAQLCHYGKHYYVKTPLILKGRGIEHLRTLTAKDLVPQAQHKAGWHEYKVTRRAMSKLTAEYSISRELLLD